MARDGLECRPSAPPPPVCGSAGRCSPHGVGSLLTAGSLVRRCGVTLQARSACTERVVVESLPVAPSRAASPTPGSPPASPSRRVPDSAEPRRPWPRSPPIRRTHASGPRGDRRVARVVIVPALLVRMSASRLRSRAPLSKRILVLNTSSSRRPAHEPAVEQVVVDLLDQLALASRYSYVQQQRSACSGGTEDDHRHAPDAASTGRSGRSSGIRIRPVPGDIRS